MPAPSSRPLLSLTLALTLLAAFCLLLTVIAIERAAPDDLARVFALSPSAAK